MALVPIDKTKKGGLLGGSSINKVVDDARNAGPKTSPGGSKGPSAKNPSSTAVKGAPVSTAGPVAPITPTLENYLGSDVTYQDQLRNFDRTLADFLANMGTRNTRTTADFGEGKRNMEQQRVTDLDAIKNDFASRGLLNSGLFVDKNAQYEKDYAQQLADAERLYNQAISDLSTEETNFRREQDLQKESAKQDAARRRAEKYGV